MNYPQYPGGYDPYLTTAPPSGVTAIIAGVLAAIGSVGQLFGGGSSIFVATAMGPDLIGSDSTGLFGYGWYPSYAVANGVFAIIAAILLGAGAVTLFGKKPLGRILIAAGCAIVVLAGLAGFVITLSLGAFSGAGLIGSGIGGVIGLLFPIATVVLALVPATAKWLAYHQTAGYPQGGQAGYPPPPPVPGGYPQVGPPGYPSQGPSGYPQPGQQAYPSAAPSGYPQAAPSPYPSQPSAYPAQPSAYPKSDPQVSPDDATWRRPSS
ncbi:hypothetical protein [Nocardia australiensis]|uniref:hypothetical protein n=1 Tax=Nocardia australiensis TaxID=2887191 RepID=UPI001D134B92|nr:hypothetical protein [Nocardia australiensis]